MLVLLQVVLVIVMFVSYLLGLIAVVTARAEVATEIMAMILSCPFFTCGTVALAGVGIIEAIDRNRREHLAALAHLASLMQPAAVPMYPPPPYYPAGDPSGGGMQR